MVAWRSWVPLGKCAKALEARTLVIPSNKEWPSANVSKNWAICCPGNEPTRVPNNRGTHAQIRLR